MKKLAIILFAFTLIIWVFVSCTKEDPSLITGQDSPEYSLGCQLLPNAEYEAIPLATTLEYELKTLPATIILSSPPVGNQGSEGSCVAWGTTYAGRSVDWYMTNSNTSYSRSTNTFSPEYVFNQIKIGTTCTAGSYVTSGLNLLKSQGVCTWTSMPSVSGCSLLPNTAQKTEAANYKITSYSRITISTSTIKTYLANNKPVIVAGPVNNAFVHLLNGQVLGAFSGTSLGGHCYCIIGYDDAKGAFKFQNSWGTGWASQGFGWIAYANVTSWWREAYIVNTVGL